MEKYKGRFWTAAIIACLAAEPAVAAVVKTSFGVHATVVETCRIVPGQANPCAPAAAAQPSAAVNETPLVTISHDQKAGTVIETIEF